MKKIFLFIAIIAVTITAHAQKSPKIIVPENVSNGFNKKFPNASNVKWEKENEKNYEANFKMNNKKQSALFNTIGIWQESEIEIKISELPETVKQTISKQFIDYKIKEVDKIIKPLSSFYEVELIKGKEIIEATFSSNGAFVSKQNKADDKD